MIAWQSALEALHVERDVVVHQEDRPGAVSPRVGDVGQHAVDRIRMEVAAAHLDDRAEAAVEGAPARGLDDVHRPAEQRVAVRHARRRFGQRQRFSREPGHRAIGVVHQHAVAARRRGRRWPRGRRPAPARAAAPERVLALAPHHESTLGAGLVGIRREARIVTAGDDVRVRSEARGPARAMAQRRARAGRSSPTGRRRRAVARAPAARRVGRDAALHQDRGRRSRPRWCGSTLPASDASAPLGMRMATGAMCSNESGIDSRSTRMRRSLQ